LQYLKLTFQFGQATQGMLEDWQENLAIITANRTKGDDLVITHLGDCLWKEKNEVRVLYDEYTLLSPFISFKRLESNSPFILCRLHLPTHAIYLLNLILIPILKVQGCASLVQTT
jgi:hypothetical protein